MALQFSLKMAYQVVNLSRQNQMEINESLSLDFKSHRHNKCKLLLSDALKVSHQDQEEKTSR
jgi:hypothetical protein